MKRTKLSKLIALALLPAGVALTGAMYPGIAAGAGESGAAATSAQQERAGGAMHASEARIPQDATAFWASDLIGLNVAMAGDREGEIQDIVVNAESGEVAFAITEIEGLEGEERLYAVPLDMFQVENNRLALKVDRDWFERRTAWNDAEWPDLQDDKVIADLVGGGTVPANGNYHRMSELLDRDVEGSKGGEIGELKDAAINMEARKVEFVLLEHDPGWLSLENEYAFPLSAFSFPRTRADGDLTGISRIKLQVSETKLESMEPLSKEEYRRITEPGWISEITSAF